MNNTEDIKRVRMVLKDDVDEDDIDGLAFNANWDLIEVAKEDPREGTPYQVIWATEGEREAIHYINDHVLNLRYVLVKGNAPDNVLWEIRKTLHVYEVSEIIEELNSATEADAIVKAINKLAVAAPQSFDFETYNLFKKYAAHPDPEVRSAVIFAMSYPAWKEFRQLVEQLGLNDPNSEVRETAQYFLEGYSRFGN